MKSLFNAVVIDEITGRINKINTSATPQWGKMNAYQMLKHCTETTRSSFGERIDKRPFMSYLIGQMLMKKIVKDDKPSSKNTPTHPAFVVKEKFGDSEKQKQILISLVKQYGTKTRNDFDGRVHPFFGKMTADQYGILDYKHLDHHLRQFGV